VLRDIIMLGSQVVTMLVVRGVLQVLLLT